MVWFTLLLALGAYLQRSISPISGQPLPCCKINVARRHGIYATNTDMSVSASAALGLLTRDVVAL